MKILSCHITGFGKFVNRAFDMSKPIVVCKQENGWGKTTLADFIECMFYGLDNGRKTSVSENFRMKYEPWSGARYGGAIIIEESGKTYRIERYFGKTPSADTARVFDGNNMVCYDFGERAERLGETLFGVDRESYRKTAYIPQGITEETPLTGDIKSKLLSVLSSTPTDSGAQKATERLDAAERALRAKRRPAKGKLDEIEERLTYLETQKADCIRASQTLRAQRETLAQYAQKMQGYTAELNKLSTLLEEYTRRGEMAANDAARKEIETTYQTAAAALQELKAFFGAIDPASLNTEGLEQGVTEYYRLKGEVAEAENKLSALYAGGRERQMLQTQLTACEKTLESYEMLARSQEKKEKREKKDAHTQGRYARKRRKRGMLLLFISFCVAVVGAVLTESSKGFGIALLVVGALGTLYGFGIVYRHTRGLPSARKQKLVFDDPEIAARYKATREETDELLQKLSQYPADTEKEYAYLAKETEDKKLRIAQLESAISGFIGNFRFEAVYDYRAALSRIKESVADYVRYGQSLQDSAQKLSTLAPAQNGGVIADYSRADMENLVARRNRLEEERERLRGEYARLSAEADGLETRAFQLREYQGEEMRLEEERARLERRLTAIRAAKEILTRARANMATRYLDPVESKCRRYAEILGFAPTALLRFNGEGVPVMEENASLRAMGYYSTGLKELLDFCVRIALAETLFTTRRPPLILDDPFANLDDEKTVRVKTLVKELSNNYQIIYFTCKQERTL
ncbi:MAG: AAA family ATPase [Clostridia bacterium]|nr:AAA family ATPase [Clostridia bacterium]